MASKLNINEYIGKMIDASGKTQREIANEVGYTNANVISMFKTGTTRIPLDKIPDIAKAIFADPGHLFRLALEQYWPGRGDVIKSIFGTTITTNEEVVMQAWRTATSDLDPKLSEVQLRALTEAIKTITTQ